MVHAVAGFGCGTPAQAQTMNANLSPTAIVVDDEILIALTMEDLLRDLGYDVLSLRSIDEAIEAIERVPVSLAILDLQVGRQITSSLAEKCELKGIPFAFCTGSDRSRLDGRFDHVPFIGKPFLDSDVKEIISSLSKAGS
jgi:CheY-like chemotaxis protein